MFFLFSDMLLYTSKGVTGTSHFRIRGLLPLRGMLVTGSPWWPGSCDPGAEPRPSPTSTRLEKEKWICDLNTAIDVAKSGAPPTPTLLAPCSRFPLSRGPTPSPGSSEEVSPEKESEDTHGVHGSLEGQGQHRANTTVHVCWYRNTSVSRADQSAAVENQLSGYLLRKFKNSNGWQKLWVVFTNFCLFFYKTHQDDYPLASLPLLGYSVSVPKEADCVHKEHVFKLQFKSHVYFFRAESKYTFERWMEVIESASSSPGRARRPEDEA
uniref:PH domain-containing protein n=1 Tax=Panthera leo TaxID=9689 RepID=A0A8C8X7H8_PANLE